MWRKIHNLQSTFWLNVTIFFLFNIHFFNHFSFYHLLLYRLVESICVKSPKIFWWLRVSSIFVKKCYLKYMVNSISTKSHWKLFTYLIFIHWIYPSVYLVGERTIRIDIDGHYYKGGPTNRWLLDLRTALYGEVKETAGKPYIFMRNILCMAQSYNFC